MKKLFFLASALLCGALSASAVDYLVQTGEDGDGKWTDDAIKALNVATDKVIDLSKDGATLPTTGEIWFAAGEYEFTAQYAITNGAKLYGGFAGTETNTTRALNESKKPYDFANPTIFNVKQPETGNKVKIFPDKVQTFVLNGICIQNSVGTNAAGVISLYSGSQVLNCTFENCSSTNQGGALIAYNANAKIIGCLFKGNYAKQGGAIHIGDGNTTEYTITIDKCDFLNNYVFNGGNAGGAINKQNDKQTVLISNCNFIGNDAPNNGATLSISGVSTTTVSNSLITGSTTKTAIYVPGSLNLYYCTVVENAAGAMYVNNTGATNATIDIKNNVFWATTAAAANCGLGSARGTAANNASLQTWTGSDKLTVAENIKLEPANTGSEEGKLYPVFADPENGDFNLGKGSALIGKGVEIVGITTDIEGVTRTSLDLGAYAYVEGKVPTAVENTEKAPIDIQAALQAGEVFNILGQRVGELQAGNIYIVGGQKVLMR